MNRIRTVQWGHWGITFSEHDVDADGRRSYAPAILHGALAFPVGPCGPVDLPQRAKLTRACSDWTERGALPKGLL